MVERPMPKSQSAPSGVTHVMWYRGLPVNRRAASRADAERLLRIYLCDHFARATGCLGLARRIERNHQDEAYSPPLTAFVEEIAEDREALRRIMRDLGFAVQPAKSALAWAAERAGRLKPNGRLVGRSPLSSVVELESMRMGVEGKASCWRTLRVLADEDSRLSASELDALVERAEEQAKRLEEMRVGMLAPTFRPRDPEVEEAEAAKRAGEPRGPGKPADAEWESESAERAGQHRR